MTNRIILIVIASLFLSCKNKTESNSFKSFYYSNQSLKKNNSLKFFENNDTVYFETRLPEKIDNFYCLINHEDKQQLNELVKQIDFSMNDSIKPKKDINYKGAFIFAINKSQKADWLFIPEDERPNQILKKIAWFENFKKKRTFYQTKKTINLNDLNSEDISFSPNCQ